MWFMAFLFFTSVQCLERKMSYEKTPGCAACNVSVYYARAEGPNDTLHYVWDFTKRPTIFLALTGINDNITFNWTEFAKDTSNSFSFTSSPLYTFALIINKIVEFNDVNDTGVLTTTTPNISYSSEYFIWESPKDVKSDPDLKSVSILFTSSNFSENSGSLNGTISVQLTAFGTENHDSELPRLLHSPNSTQCTIILNHLVSTSGFNNSRFAVEFIIVSADNRSSTATVRSRKNLDDENSPGVFSMVDLLTPQAENQQYRGAFLQWRPIVYTAKIPNISNSTELFAYGLTNVSDPKTTLRDTLSYKFYGSMLNEILVQQTIVSLGSKEDGFYQKTNYSSWTFLINYGSPEDEKFSLLVIMVMAIGLGLPSLLILLGGTYMCARRLRRIKDELSLER